MNPQNTPQGKRCQSQGIGGGMTICGQREKRGQRGRPSCQKLKKPQGFICMIVTSCPGLLQEERQDIINYDYFLLVKNEQEWRQLGSKQR